jgi:hypothetical protein
MYQQSSPSGAHQSGCSAEGTCSQAPSGMDDDVVDAEYHDVA